MLKLSMANWAEFKATIDKGSSLHHTEVEMKYFLYGLNGNVTYDYILKKDGGADQADFEDNYKSKSNSKIGYSQNVAFASKYIYVSGAKKSLYKRVHGVNETIAANTTANIDFIIPYAHCKFSGANIFGSSLGDTLDFEILDTATNTYSGAPLSPLPTYYPYYVLNQFGFEVEMPGSGVYENTSNYEASLQLDMTIRCRYTNSTDASAYISMNVWLHEVV